MAQASSSSPAGCTSDRSRQRALTQRPGEMLRAVEPAAGEVTCVYQPVVELTTRRTVGYEALTRGPAGTDLEAPMALFERMRDAGEAVALDRACRDADETTWSKAPADLRCIIELTERDLAKHPAELLPATSHIRELNWGIALDDVGADLTSLSLMTMLRPDVIKLDLGLVQPPRRGPGDDDRRGQRPGAGDRRRHRRGRHRDRGAPPHGAGVRRDARPGLPLRAARAAAS